MSVTELLEKHEYLKKWLETPDLFAAQKRLNDGESEFDVVERMNRKAEINEKYPKKLWLSRH